MSKPRFLLASVMHRDSNQREGPCGPISVSQKVLKQQAKGAKEECAGWSLSLVLNQADEIISIGLLGLTVFGGRQQRTLHFRPLPYRSVWSVRSATKRDDAKRLLADGIDPVVAKTGSQARTGLAAPPPLSTWGRSEWMEKERGSLNEKTMAGKVRYVGISKSESVAA